MKASITKAPAYCRRKEEAMAMQAERVMKGERFPFLAACLAMAVLGAGTLAAGPARAGGLMTYEVGTADVGLASAGYGARAQDASTVLTNPAGMTRLDGHQLLVSGQVLWGNTKLSIGSGTSLELGGGDGGRAVGSDGWFLGGGGFFTYSLSPELKLGFALTGNFGAPLKYDDDWAGRYYVQETTLLGISFLPSIAYKATDKLSLGASVNAMYGIYKNKVAINIPDALRPGGVAPAQRASGDAQLELDDQTWGWGVNLGLLYEVDARTRFGLTWSSQIDLDFSSSAKFSNLGQLGTNLQNAGLLNSTVNWIYPVSPDGFRLEEALAFFRSSSSCFHAPAGAV
jgi:long-chain fatty acid transport protein